MDLSKLRLEQIKQLAIRDQMWKAAEADEIIWQSLAANEGLPAMIRHLAVLVLSEIQARKVQAFIDLHSEDT